MFIDPSTDPNTFEFSVSPPINTMTEEQFNEKIQEMENDVKLGKTLPTREELIQFASEHSE